MKRWWLSFLSYREDYRPLKFPPREAIRGWWCSGDQGDGAAIICAVVDAPSEREAKKEVKRDWPEACGWRFIEEVGFPGIGGDRFPPSGWMKPRLAVLKGAPAMSERRFRKRPVIIEAMRVGERTLESVANWCGGSVKGVRLPPDMRVIDIQTLEGEMRANVGDWIIRGIKGEFYPCNPDIFDATYEEVE